MTLLPRSPPLGHKHSLPASPPQRTTLSTKFSPILSHNPLRFNKLKVVILLPHQIAAHLLPERSFFKPPVRPKKWKKQNRSFSSIPHNSISPPLQQHPPNPALLLFTLIKTTPQLPSFIRPTSLTLFVQLIEDILDQLISRLKFPQCTRPPLQLIQSCSPGSPPSPPSKTQRPFLWLLLSTQSSPPPARTLPSSSQSRHPPQQTTSIRPNSPPPTNLPLPQPSLPHPLVELPTP